MEGMRISCVLSVDRSRAATGPASGCIPLQRPRPHACRPDRTLADKNQPARPASIASADAEHVAVVAIDVELHRASIAGLALDLVEAVLPLDLAQVAVAQRSEEHTSELQSPCNLVCRLLLEKKKQCMPSCCMFACLIGHSCWISPSAVLSICGPLCDAIVRLYRCRLTASHRTSEFLSMLETV